jgi:hypothetical protein
LRKTRVRGQVFRFERRAWLTYQKKTGGMKVKMREYGTFLSIYPRPRVA